MKVWTFGEGDLKVKTELDLVNETFLSADEYVGIWNDAVQRAAAHVYKLGVEDEYFTTQTTIALVSGQVRFTLPSDIYAQKIRALIYARGTEIYEVFRIRRRSKYVQIAEVNQAGQDAAYRYDLENPSVATGYQLVLVPASRDTDPVGSPSLTLHYVREALYIPLVTAGSQAATNATKIDLPQFMTYVFADVKAAIAAKIPHPNLADFESKRDQELRLMIDTLTEQVPDDCTEVVPDLSHYEGAT